MNLPVQAKPVLRDVNSTRIAIDLTNTVMPSGCSWRKELRCASALVACAATCAAPGVGWAACVACFAGVGAPSCIDCL